MKLNWTSNQIKNLFSLVEKYKNTNKPLLDAFKEFAKSNNKNVFSVRNFYYKKCDEFLTNIELQKQFDINIKLHEKNNFAKFDKRQTDKLIEYIKNKKEQGYSVRNACLMLAENDATKLIRFQNKYRQITKQNSNHNEQNNNQINNFSKKTLFFNQKNEKNNENLKKITENFEKSENTKNNIIKKQYINFDEDIQLFTPQKTYNFIKNNENLNAKNVLNFPSNQQKNYTKLSDLEIQSLFSGLINLIKKSTEAHLQEKIKDEQNKLSVVIRNSAIELNQKDEKLDKLLLENQKLTSKVLSLQEKIDKLRLSQIKNIDFPPI